MGINPELAGGSLRLTISDETTIEEADYVADTVIKTVKKLRI
jgi:cysteine sulfinate desulfinase/cysteine desulfurase-like protein